MSQTTTYQKPFQIKYMITMNNLSLRIHNPHNFLLKSAITNQIVVTKPLSEIQK